MPPVSDRKSKNTKQRKKKVTNARKGKAKGPKGGKKAKSAAVAENSTAVGCSATDAESSTAVGSSTAGTPNLRKRMRLEV